MSNRYEENGEMKQTEFTNVKDRNRIIDIKIIKLNSGLQLKFVKMTENKLRKLPNFKNTILRNYMTEKTNWKKL